MTPELYDLEKLIMVKGRYEGRMEAIREALAAYMNTLELNCYVLNTKPKDTMGRRAINWIYDIVGK